MPYGDSECKTFYSQLILPAVLSGLLAIPCVLSVLLLLTKSDSALPLLLIFAGADAFFWLFFFCRVRFERDFAVIWYCTVFPSRIDYAEVSGMQCLYIRRPGTPSFIEFRLKNGRKKRWSLDLFSETACREIVQEMEARLDLSSLPDPAAEEELLDVSAWAEKTCRPHLAEKIVLCVVGVLMLALVIWGVCRQLAWDERVRSWDKADGIILKNTTKRVRSGKSTKTVADVEYEYTYKGTSCTGTRIVYDSDTFPKLKPGAHRQVIVNPEDPRDSAIMFWYSGYWWLMRYTDCMFFGLIFLIMSGIFTSLVTRKVPAVPESLKKYLKTFSQEEFDTALKRERPGIPLAGVEMNQPMEYREDSRYGILRARRSPGSRIVFALVLLAGVALAVAVPVVWFGVAITGAVFALMSLPAMTVFDFQEKKIYRCRRFRPEKFASMRSVSFSEIDHLSVSVSVQSKRNRSGRRIGLFAVKQDGTQVPICGAVYRNLGVLLELLPDLAEKMGHLPILFY